MTYFKENPLVDETKIALWGLCFGGNVTLAAAAFEYVISSQLHVFALDLPYFSCPLTRNPT